MAHYTDDGQDDTQNGEEEGSHNQIALTFPEERESRPDNRSVSVNIERLSSTPDVRIRQRENGITSSR
jgi:hypothetical protein